MVVLDVDLEASRAEELESRAESRNGDNLSLQPGTS